MAKKKKTSKRPSAKNEEKRLQVRKDEDDIGTVLCGLCRGSHWPEVFALLKENPRTALEILKMDNNNSTTILHQVITTRSPDMKSRSDIIEHIVKHTPEAARIKNGFGSLPLHVVTQRNIKLDAVTKEQVILSLVDAYPGALFVEGGVGKRSPLHIVFTDYTSSAIVKRMLDVGRGAALVKDKRGWLPIHVAASRHCSPHKIEMLLEACPRSLFATTEDTNETPLQLATSTATKTHPNHTLIKYLKAAEAKFRAEGVDDEDSSNARLRINDVKPQKNNAIRSKRRLPTSLDHSIGRGATKRRRRSKESPQDNDTLDESTSLRNPSPSLDPTQSSTTEEDPNGVENDPQDCRYPTSTSTVLQHEMNSVDEDVHESAGTEPQISEEERQQALTLLMFRQGGEIGAKRKVDEDGAKHVYNALRSSRFNDDEDVAKSYNSSEQDDSTTDSSEASIDDMPPLSSGMILPTPSSGMAHPILPSLGDEIDSKPKAISFSKDSTDFVAQSSLYDEERFYSPKEAPVIGLCVECQKTSKDDVSKSPQSPDRKPKAKGKAENCQYPINLKMLDAKSDDVVTDLSPHPREELPLQGVEFHQGQPLLALRAQELQEVRKESSCQDDVESCQEKEANQLSPHHHSSVRENLVQDESHYYRDVCDPEGSEEALNATSTRAGAESEAYSECSPDHEAPFSRKNSTTSVPRSPKPLYTQHKPLMMLQEKPPNLDNSSSALTPAASQMQTHCQLQELTAPLSPVVKCDKKEGNAIEPRAPTKSSPSSFLTNPLDKRDHSKNESTSTSEKRLQSNAVKGSLPTVPAVKTPTKSCEQNLNVADTATESIRRASVCKIGRQSPCSDPLESENEWTDHLRTTSKFQKRITQTGLSTDEKGLLSRPSPRNKPILEKYIRCVQGGFEEMTSARTKQKSSTNAKQIGESEDSWGIVRTSIVDEEPKTRAGNIFEVPNLQSMLNSKEGSAEAIKYKQYKMRCASNSKCNLDSSSGSDDYGKKLPTRDSNHISVSRSAIKQSETNSIQLRSNNVFSPSIHPSTASPLRSRRLRSREVEDIASPMSDNQDQTHGTLFANAVGQKSNLKVHMPLTLNTESSIIPTREGHLLSGREPAFHTILGHSSRNGTEGKQGMQMLPYQSDRVREQIIRDRLMIARIKAKHVGSNRVHQNSNLTIPSMSKKKIASVPRQDKEAFIVAEEVKRRRMLILQHEHMTRSSLSHNLNHLDHYASGMKGVHKDSRDRDRLSEDGREKRYDFRARQMLTTASISSLKDEGRRELPTNGRIQLSTSTKLAGNAGVVSNRSESQIQPFALSHGGSSSQILSTHKHPRPFVPSEKYTTDHHGSLRVAAFAHEMRMQTTNLFSRTQRARAQHQSYNSSHYTTYADGLLHAPTPQSALCNTLPTAQRPSRTRSERRNSRNSEKVQWFQPYMGGL